MFSSKMSKDSQLSFYEAWDWAEQHNADDGRGAHQEDDAAAALEIKEERAEDTKKKDKKKRKRRRHHKDKTKEESEGKEKEKKKKERRKRSEDPRPHIYDSDVEHDKKKEESEGKEKEKKKERRKRSRDPRPHIYDSDVEHDKSSSLDEEAMKQFFEAWLEEDSSSETEVDEDAEKAFYNSHNVASSSGVVKTEEEEPQDLTVDTAPQDVPKGFSSAPWNVKKPTWSLDAEEPTAAVPIAKAPTASLGATSKFQGAPPTSVIEGAATVPLPPLPPPSYPPPAATPSAPAASLPRGKAGPKYEGYYYSMFSSRREYERLVRNQYRKRGGNR